MSLGRRLVLAPTDQGLERGGRQDGEGACWFAAAAVRKEAATASNAADCTTASKV